MSKQEIRQMVSYLSFVVKLTSGRGHLRRAARRLCADDDDRGAPRDQARPGRLQPVWDEDQANNRCRSHQPLSSREPTPSRSNGYAVGPEKGTGGGTGIASGSGRVDSSGNAFFDCLVCGRSITSNRYAPHLASCLGLSGSTRRGASRMAAAKARLGTDRASPSPYLASEDSDAESVSSKRRKLNGKRAASPQKPTFKKKLQGHTSGSAPPRMPSKLGRPPKSAATQKAHSASPFTKAGSGSASPKSAGVTGKSASPDKPVSKPGPKPGAKAAAAKEAAAAAREAAAKEAKSKSKSRSPAPPAPAPAPAPAPPPADESSEGEDDY
ncbi:hypothetical protein A1Q2_08436 [Trichosporon asahii var. asahii CBS 8904]|uniref:SAGA-associated factor 11 n=2 Tax=Trichosporon asahii var. asahii TaxID=189963 RepID=K1W678_TRIAC|nr:hypothetical protein A1Q1_01158 [Trichosporon asahii var. asahii CBS 2479]EJT49660.1 hypothetical protein A1Q1_01158 [Trichosporon asahii var. asahii CBS 2479]EKC97278.1 hypothetical protein A1Q2_08436 [Trichosporon asahii var. asahii CBS 8904]